MEYQHSDADVLLLLLLLPFYVLFMKVLIYCDMIA